MPTRIDNLTPYAAEPIPEPDELAALKAENAELREQVQALEAWRDRAREVVSE